jgi:hypothetical protein
MDMDMGISQIKHSEQVGAVEGGGRGGRERGT